uniref:Phosphodiesterase n=2 Tax=Panagrolaimus sp. PS1159 TaxID=55785 RepID=A0AC35G4E8_9BILA
MTSKRKWRHLLNYLLKNVCAILLTAAAAFYPWPFKFYGTFFVGKRKGIRASKPRVSNITFSTVTSATGLPTIAAEPSRPRSSSYWKPQDRELEHQNSQSGSLGSQTQSQQQQQQQLSPSPIISHTPSPSQQHRRRQSSSTSPGPPRLSSTSALSGGCVSPLQPPISPKAVKKISFNSVVTPLEASPSSASNSAATTVAHTSTLSVSPIVAPLTSPSTSSTTPPSNTLINCCKSPILKSPTPSSTNNRVSFGLAEDESDESFASTATDSMTSYIVGDGTVFDRLELEKDQTLKRVSEWSFPIFHIADRYKTTVLTRMTWSVFKEADLFRIFKLPMQKFFNFFHALECGYWEIPYHNRIHAADVLHGCYYLTCHPVRAFVGRPSSPELQFHDCGAPLPVSENMSTLELMALFTAAAMHDFDHPGRTNAFLVASEDKKAILYNDRSVLENHHAAESWRLLCQRENNFIEGLDSAETKRFRYLVLEYILATDLKQHFDIIMQFNDKAADMDLTNEADRVLMAQTLIKFADINSPAKPYQLHRQWTERICQEFYEQGDEEKRRRMAVSPYMDRNEPDVAKLQDSFIAHIVNPLAVALNEAGLLPILPGLEEPELIINLKHNHQKWLLEIEAAAQTASSSFPPNESEELSLTASQNHIHPPSMQCLPEEESEDSPNNSIINNNVDDFNSATTNSPQKKQTNGSVTVSEKLPNGTPVFANTSDSSIGRFEDENLRQNCNTLLKVKVHS